MVIELGEYGLEAYTEVKTVTRFITIYFIRATKRYDLKQILKNSNLLCLLLRYFASCSCEPFLIQTRTNAYQVVYVKPSL